MADGVDTAKQAMQAPRFLSAFHHPHREIELLTKLSNRNNAMLPFRQGGQCDIRADPRRP